MKKKGPLSGIKVLDLTAMVSGPTATMMLGDQGADVIKVEPLEGELMRKVGDEVNGMTNSFLCCNRSKRSITLDLKRKRGISRGIRIFGTPSILYCFSSSDCRIFLHAFLRFFALRKTGRERQPHFARSS